MPGTKTGETYKRVGKPLLCRQFSRGRKKIAKMSRCAQAKKWRRDQKGGGSVSFLKRRRKRRNPVKSKRMRRAPAFRARQQAALPIKDQGKGKIQFPKIKNREGHPQQIRKKKYSAT